MKNVLQSIFYLSLSTLILSACFGSRPNIKTPNTNPNTSDNSESSNSNTNSGFIDSRPIQAKQRVLGDGDSLRIFLELEIPRLSNKPEDKTKIQQEISIVYGLLANYSSRDYIEKHALKFSKNQIQKIGPNYYLNFKIPKHNTISEVLILEVIDKLTRKKDQLDFMVNYTVTRIRERFSFFTSGGERPLFSNYALTGDTLQVRDIANRSKPLIVRHFRSDYEPAAPPMSAKKTILPSRIKSDSSFVIQSHQDLTFDKKGAYLIQEDSSNFYGLSIFVSDLKYPKLSRVQDVIEPLVYITTPEEMEALQTSKEPKKEMDRLWLKLMSGNVKTAKQTIRNYFQRIKLANTFFSTHKEGWKTDMGMIYVIYGRPSRVIRNNDKELWIYTQSNTFSEMNFTFLRRPSQFSENNFELLRFPEYEEIWYPMIEQWRSGNVQ